MDEALHHFVSELHGGWLALVIVVSLAVLGKAADWLVDEAVALSERSGIPTVVIGATIVSLGTTAPEAAVSVFAALQGSPGLALGNAVGSIICDTGLILGLACILAPLRLDRAIVNRQGWIQLGAAVALVAGCFPWSNAGQVFVEGGRLPQWVGIAFLVALVVYMVLSIRWASAGVTTASEKGVADDEAGSLALVVLKLVGSLALVVLAAQVLIPSVREAATRIEIPESIIAATLVAFGTSLPELVTAVTAARRGHGELAVGNIVGADILNVLFVAGASATATPAGLAAGGHFFVVLFPAMLFILLTFRIGIFVSGDSLRKPFGFVLLAAYGVYMVVSFLVPGDGAGM